MKEAGFNPELIRVAVIVIFFAVTFFLRAAKASKTARPAPGAGAGKGAPLDLLRDTIRQASEQARARQSQAPVNSETIQLNEQLQQPPALQPESSFLPSILLLALLVCLCFMAYRYWAG